MLKWAGKALLQKADSGKQPEQERQMHGESGPEGLERSGKEQAHSSLETQAERMRRGREEDGWLGQKGEPRS